ncbi:four-carbon acid sugar kinase family protein [Saccharococcus caldoxylosilyticus]|jgi:D-threonate/D-erythronate kinase|uniref:four-carbon acid sugar kinase family protein n=1 Tax=Saccharococcus caldoxylosilyticus TaxID=81408 RepID=UPI0002D7C71F|nr:four-carbon acid sugar kinase family protein [Parageobacillus caldoxylosilyticus]BDG37636.1 membrane protein [Parageobacillus caldoxylosilyticus]BDG41428.1 membrane protein [Parageobacillus caldoxylosilyticus]
MNKLAIIADDLTGASDSGVQFARKGLVTQVLFDLTGLSGKREAEVIVVDTDSRALPALDAYRQVQDAAKTLQEMGFNHLYKKIDSTLRGNIGAEIDAIYDTIKPTFMIIAPGYPKNGRTIYKGYHFLHDTLLHETELSRDPKCPIKESYVPSLIAKQTKRPIGLIDYQTLRLGFDKVKEQLDHYRANGIPYIVFDSLSEEDLQRIVRYVCRINEKVVWVGSAGLANYLPEAYHLQKSKKATMIEPSERPILLVVGSVSQVSRKQLDRALSLKNVKGIQIDSVKLVSDNQSRYEEMEKALHQAENWAKQGYHIALYSSASPNEIKQVQEIGEAKGLGAIEISNFIAQNLGEVASTLINKGYFRGMILTGGDTAKHVCNKVGATGFELLDEVETGVPIAKLIHDSGMYVVTKAGAFGSENTFIQAIHQLQGVDVK